MFQPNASVSVMAGGRTPADGKRLGEQMSKKISGLFALLAFLGLSLFLINCGSSSSRPAGVLYVLSQGENNVGSFAIDLGSGRLSLLNKTASTDTTPSTILLDPTGTVAYVLNTGSNSITTYTVSSDGSLSAPTSTALPIPNSVAMTRDAAGTFLFVVSQGTVLLQPGKAACSQAQPDPGCAILPALTVFAIQSGSATLTQVGSPTALNQVPTSVAAATVTTTLSDNTQVTKTLLYITNDVDLIPLQ